MRTVIYLTDEVYNWPKLLKPLPVSPWELLILEFELTYTTRAFWADKNR